MSVASPDPRPPLSAATIAGLALRPATTATGTELFETLRRARRDIEDLRIALTTRPGAKEVSGREERRFGERHEFPRS